MAADTLRPLDSPLTNAHDHPLDLSLATLREEYPGEYLLWVRIGTLAAAISYLAGCIAIAAEESFQALLRYPDPYVLLGHIAALVALSTRHPRVASALVVAGVWADLHAALILNGGPNTRTTSVVLPVLVLAIGLLLGGRAARALTVTTLFSIPLALEVSSRLGLGPGLRGEGIGFYLVSIGAVLLATYALLAGFLRTMARILWRSRNNERRARELAEDTPDAMIGLSPKGDVEVLNHAAEQLLGLSRQSALGLPHAELPLSGSNGAWPLKLDTLSGTQSPLELSTRDGTTKLEALVRPTTRADGSQGRLVVLRDITQRRHAEAHARELQTQLQHAQKLEALGLLAGGIAHDFNNLLTAVSGYGSLLATSTDPEAREFSTEVIAVQERGAALVRQLLAFARKDLVTPKPMDVGSVVTQTAMLVQRLLGERVKLQLQVQETCPIVADPGQIEQVILNLAANARDAMPSGGTLRVECHADLDTVSLKVSDTGIGMSAATKARLFEPFFTTKAVGQGTGLGLSTVHSIVAASGGTIDVDTELGRGTHFTITWPRTALPTADLSAPSTAPRANGAGRLIVVVEDNDAARAFMKRLLERNGFKVEVARDGDEAQALLSGRQAPPDLLLTDVIMPGITGPQLVRRTLQRWPELRFLFVSGYLGDAAEQFGFDPIEDLLPKPFTADALLLRIEAKLSRASGSFAAHAPN